ncbi:cell division initiation protein [Eubacterium ruminantium]|nr:cell division initiation protein [Eubacterium ruminantium]
MLTPVDIQQKKFKTGFGFNKDDVTRFFEEVSKSYEELYRSNAELKEKVITLNDGLQHYKTTEEQLQKNLMLAEKNSQQSKSNAVKEAKNIELEAKNRANEIVNQAYIDLGEMENKMKELETRYAEYKSEFALLVKRMFNILDLEDIDPDAKIDPKFMSIQKAEPKKSQAQSSSFSGGGLGTSMFESSEDSYDSFADFDNEFGSDRGGLGGGMSDNKSMNSNSSNVYGSILGGSGIDPFSGKSREEDSSSDKKPAKKYSVKEDKPKTTFTIKGENKDEFDYKPKTDTQSSFSRSTLSFRPADEYNDIEAMFADSKVSLRHHEED